ncbi:MAG TPA: acyl-CoA dehydrogenase family protein [Rhizomicrobium sp.]|nr:acyl-CoA dehydrogenase family protein [Rhizomicrobium sp.]
MDFEDTQTEAAFRAEVRAWLAANAPRFVPAAEASEAERVKLMRAWTAEKAKAGYVGFTLPRELGGRGGSAVEEIIFVEEQARVAVPHIETFNLGPSVGIPVLMKHAHPEHVSRLAGPTLRGEVVWCQMFSEPGAGSDVAAIRTRAVRDGDEWVVNGQKVWTSGAHIADWGMLITRTNPAVPKHQGLTFFILDMKSPGVEVRPLKQMWGRSEFNEVFFTDVRIPDHQRLGDIDGGWQVVLTTLSNERLALIYDRTVGRNLVAPLLRLASHIPSPEGGSLVASSGFCDRLASYYAVVAGVDHIRKRISTSLSRNERPGAEATIGKMTLARVLQEMAAFGMDIAGTAGQVADADPDLAEIQESFFMSAGYRMGGGTEEIGKNIIAERVLGLPQDIRVDKNTPFQSPAGGR